MAHEQLALLSPMYDRYHYGQPIGVTVEIRRLLKNRHILQLSEKDLCHFDQEHFLGLEPVKLARDMLKIDHRVAVIDIGSGLGGPARYLAEETGARIDSVEVQPKRADLARLLNSVVRVSDRVSVTTADFCTLSGLEGKYDAALSLLSMLHFPDKRLAHQRAFESLKQGGRLFLEDYVSARELSPAEEATLLKSVAFPNPLTREEYLSSLRSAGFNILHAFDTTASWNEQVQQRSRRFPEARSALEADYDNVQLSELGAFFNEVSDIFHRDLIRGIRVVAEKPVFP